MFRAAALVASFVGVAAFAPAGRMASSNALKMGFENEVGATNPLGFWDPLNLAKDQDTFDDYRVAELKHGRVAQLAVIGYIVPEIFKFPGNIAPGVPFASIPNGVAAIEAVPSLGWFQIVFLVGAVDYWGVLVLGDKEGKNLKTPEAVKKAKDQEINHGRLAMVAIMELLRHDAQHFVGGMYADDKLITGLPFLY